jgi:hypothetical protein
MTTVQILSLKEVGRDFILMKDATTTVRVTFADDHQFTAEDSAGFFNHLVEKPLAVPVPTDADKDFFISPDMWPDAFGNVKVIPFRFATAAVEVDGINFAYWRKKLADWKPVRRVSSEPCALCNEIGEVAAYQSPDWSLTQGWAYDICDCCVKKLGLAW